MPSCVLKGQFGAALHPDEELRSYEESYSVWLPLVSRYARTSTPFVQLVQRFQRSEVTLLPRPLVQNKFAFGSSWVQPLCRAQ